MIKKAMVLVMSCGAFALGCAHEEGTNAPQELTGVDATQETIDNLVQAGFPADDIMVVDGTVYVGRDAVVSLQASREMLQIDESRGGQEQFRTNNLVSQNVSLICIVPSASFTGNLSVGVDRAVNNYNQQNLSFRMERRAGNNTGGCGAVIRGSVGGPAGGVSGFPSGGLPFNSFQIGASTAQFGADVVEHVVTHELGHTLGFRHSDFFNRS
jgi:hypothetical protein